MYIERIEIFEKFFRCMMSKDILATEKTAEEIRNFATDIRKLETMIQSKIL